MHAVEMAGGARDEVGDSPALPHRAEPPSAAASGVEVLGALSRVALVVAAVGTLVPLAEGALFGVPPGRLLVYAGLALLYLVVIQVHLPWPTGGAGVLGRQLAALRATRPRVYVVLLSLLAFTLQLASGEPFLQPLVFVVPLMHASVALRAREAALVGALFVPLIPLGVRIGWIFPDPPDAPTLIYSTLVHATLLALVFGVTRLVGAFARQRDELARLYPPRRRVAGGRERSERRH